MKSELPAQHLAVGCVRTFGSQLMFLVAWEMRLLSSVRKYRSLNKLSSKKDFKRQIVAVAGCALAVETLVYLGGAGHSSRPRVSPSAV